MPDDKIDAALDEVLKDGVLTEHFNYTGPSDRAVPASEVRDQVREKVGPIPGLEVRVDAAVTARGGEKLELIDLSQKIKNLGLRLTGQSPEPSEDMYYFDQ